MRFLLPTFRTFFLAISFACPVLFATESVRPVSIPQSSVVLGGVAELRDDVYSADARLSTELALNERLSVYSDISYRFVSLQYDFYGFKQRHEMINLRVNGMNESYLGIKFFPVKYFGIGFNWRFAPGGGSRNDRFPRLGVEPMAVYPFSRSLSLGALFGYYTFFERDNFQPGDELGGSVSLVWRPFLEADPFHGFQFSYVFLFRCRVGESENLKMAAPYRKMNDLYSGFRMRYEAAYFLRSVPLGYGASYEISRGTLFGFETGHRIEIFGTFLWR